jgi:hypothetical protein
MHAGRVLDLGAIVHLETERRDQNLRVGAVECGIGLEPADDFVACRRH